MDQNKQVMDELMKGRKIAKQLQMHLNTLSSSHQTVELLIDQIFTSYNKLFSLLAISEDSDHDHKEFPKERKNNYMEKWKQQVEVRAEIGVEGPLDDGYSWKKYGQKDIFGAKHPRGYYQCIYRQVQGCFATKQIQRSDEDPSIFEITYRGKHICNPNFPKTPPQGPTLPPPLSLPSKIQPPPQQNHKSSEILLNFETGHQVMPKNLNTPTHFAPTSNNNFIFSTLENNFQGNNLIFPSQMSTFGEDLSVMVAKSELNRSVSTSTSSTNLHTFGMNFKLDGLELDKDQL